MTYEPRAIMAVKALPPLPDPDYPMDTVVWALDRAALYQTDGLAWALVSRITTSKIEAPQITSEKLSADRLAEMDRDLAMGTDENGVSLAMLSHYPYRNVEPRARCRWWRHEAAVMQTVPGPKRNYDVARYTCACGKREWFSNDRRKRRVGAE